MTNAAIILAAGRGLRAGGALPKQWQRLAGRAVVDHTLAQFKAHPKIDRITLVIGADDRDRLAGLTQMQGVDVVTGGPERWLSVLAGLQATQADRVLIHDGARCCVPPEVIDRVLDALEEAPAAAPALAVTDALWSGAEGRVTGVQDRTGLFRAQTPQGFHRDVLVAAYADQRDGAADDVEIARRAGVRVTIVAGDERNLKITTPEDFDRARALLEDRMTPHIPDIRTGNGFDVHRFGPGDHVMLCGVRVPHDRGLQGHSDADVGLHTVTDAIYGALAQGDIGQHFPPSDPQWKGAESHVFLSHACGLARDMGYTLTNVDLTLMCEYPKIGPVSGKMRKKLSEIMALDIDRISVKATTTERLGFTGRGEGIAAMATATLVKA